MKKNKAHRRAIVLVLASTLITLTTGCGTNAIAPTDNSKQETTVEDTTDTDDSGSRTAPTELMGGREISYNIFRTYYNKNKDENIIISPLSAEILTAMIYESTDGNTKAQLEQNIGINEDYCRVLKGAIGLQDDNLKLSNHIRLQSDYMKSLKSSYEVSLDTGYKASIGEINSDTIDELNDIVSKDTNEMIHNIFQPGDLNGVKMVALNCCAFDANWRTEFDEPFKGVFYNGDKYYETDIVHQSYNVRNNETDNTRYTENTDIGYYGIVKDYMSNEGTSGEIRYKFIGLLPDIEKGVTLSDLVNNLDEKSVTHIINDKTNYWKTKADLYSLDIRMPKFTIDSDIDIIDLYKSLGVTDLFSYDTADLSKGFENSDSLYVDKMKQIAKIELTEKGTRAAAASYSYITAGAAIDERTTFEREVYFTRPFVYIIYDTKTDTIPFMGVVNKFDKEATAQKKENYNTGNHEGRLLK